MKILNYGSLNIDFVYTVDHFVRPGETLSSIELTKFCGGKGLNQSIALARGGAQVFHAGKIGVDGEMLKKRLRAFGVNTDYLVEDEYIPTGHAIIQVESTGQNSIILYGGANTAVTEEEIAKTLDGFEAGDLLLLQNEISNIPLLISRAHQKGMTIALNPSPMSESLAVLPELQFIDWFLLNEVEGWELTGSHEPTEILTLMRKRFPRARTVLTLGREGVRCFDGERTYSHGIYDVRVVDTTAAGDTFSGFFLSSICRGDSIDIALHTASIASSLAVGVRGASDSIPSLDEVKKSGYYFDRN